MINRSQWISKADQYIQKFAVLYKTRFQQNQNPVLKKLTAIELGILNLIEWEPLIPLKKIAAYLAAPNSTITSAVNRLERRGILFRTIHPLDKRSFMLELTESGKNLTRYRTEEKEHILGALYGALEDDDGRDMMLRLLERAYNHLSDIDYQGDTG